MIVDTDIFSLVLLLNFLFYVSIPAFYPISDPVWNGNLLKYSTLVLSILMWLFFLFSSILMYFYPLSFSELSFLFDFLNFNFFSYFRILGLILLSLGTLIVFIARKELHKADKSLFCSQGIFKLIRHPIYLSYCVYFLSFFLIFPSFFTTILLFGIIGYYKTASVEELELINKFGNNYLGYITSTGKFIPKLLRKK